MVLLGGRPGARSRILDANGDGHGRPRFVRCRLRQCVRRSVMSEITLPRSSKSRNTANCAVSREASLPPRPGRRGARRCLALAPRPLPSPVVTPLASLLGARHNWPLTVYHLLRGFESPVRDSWLPLPDSQFGPYPGGFGIVRRTTTGVTISVVPLMFRLGTAQYVHAVIVGGDRTGAVPWRSGSAASPGRHPQGPGPLVPALVY